MSLAAHTETLQHIIAAVAEFHSRGWCLGTGGNFSALVGNDPLQFAVTKSGLEKKSLDDSSFLLVDESLTILDGDSEKRCSPSAETALHKTIYQETYAIAVYHTHSTWCTTLSRLYAEHGGFSIDGYEMLKGLSGVTTHEHREFFPVFENSQDMNVLSKKLSAHLKEKPNTHAVLLAGHGLYTWGNSLAEAKRHVEICEFLFEVTGRQALSLGQSGARGLHA